MKTGKHITIILIFLTALIIFFCKNDIRVYIGKKKTISAAKNNFYENRNEFYNLASCYKNLPVFFQINNFDSIIKLRIIKNFKVDTLIVINKNFDENNNRYIFFQGKKIPKATFLKISNLLENINCNSIWRPTPISIGIGYEASPVFETSYIYQKDSKKGGILLDSMFRFNCEKSFFPLVN